MKIFFCRAEAFAWKKLVFLYLNRSQLTRDRQRHMSSSFSSHQLRLSLVLFISLLISTEGGWNSSHSSLFCSSATLRPTWPKTILFHASRWLRTYLGSFPTNYPCILPSLPQGLLYHLFTPLISQPHCFNSKRFLGLPSALFWHHSEC